MVKSTLGISASSRGPERSSCDGWNKQDDCIGMEHRFTPQPWRQRRESKQELIGKRWQYLR